MPITHARVLRAGRSSQVRFGGDVRVREVPVLTHDGDVAVHIDGQRVAGQHRDPLLSLVDEFLHLLHAAADLLLLGRFPNALVELPRQLAGGERLRDGVEVPELLPVRQLRGRLRRLRLLLNWT